MTDRRVTAIGDVELARRLAAGELTNGLITEVYRRHFRSMIVAAAVVLRDHRLFAEDAAQDALVHVLLSGAVSRLRDPAKLGAFLAASARRAALDTYRVLARRQEILAEAAPANPGAFLGAAPDPSTTDRLIERLERELKLLRPEEAQVLRLRLVARKTLREAAEKLGVPYLAAAQRYSRALRRLKEQLR